MLKLRSIYMRFFGLNESQITRALDSFLDSSVNYLVTVDQYEILVDFHCLESQMDQVKHMVLNHLSKYLIGYGKDNSIEQIVGHRLIQNKLSITGAESLTAGMYQSTLGNVPGISAVFPGGFVTYSNHAKHQLLGIPSRVINKYGVVSQPVAKWMAEQSRKIMDTDLSVSFTGAAGPASLEGHPGGTVWIGLAVRGKAPKARLYHLESLYCALNGFQSEAEVKQNSRDGIRLLSVKMGLKMVNDELNLRY